MSRCLENLQKWEELTVRIGKMVKISRILMEAYEQADNQFKDILRPSIKAVQKKLEEAMEEHEECALTFLENEYWKD